MAQLKEIIEKEKDRNTMEQCRVAHIFKEGSFYRAYEWSAWLYKMCFVEMKVTHRLLKSSDDIVFVGFPVTSADKYLPEGATAKSTDDKYCEITLPMSVFPSDADMEALQTDYANWKQCQPMTEASKKTMAEEKRLAEKNAHPRLTDVMVEILAYPVEQRTPIECMMFLSEIKQKISEII
jgi:hypothetical protein